MSIEKFVPVLQPDWQIVLLKPNGKEDITGKINAQLINFSITDKRGIESDELTLTLDDTDGTLAIPPTGAKLSVSIGWVGESLIHKGNYTVDELEYSGDPLQLSIRARGAEVSKALGTKKERSWHNTTLGAIAAKIAKEHKLFLAINMALQPLVIAHEDQTNESDMNFLTRLAARFDAIATVKADHLLLTPAGQGKSVKGASLAPQTIDKTDCQPSWRWQTNDKEKFTGVRAYWHDGKAAKRKSVLVGKPKKGELAHEKSLRDTFPNATEATRAAKAELARLDRGAATFSLTLAKGRADISPEVKVTLTGWGKAEIDQQNWIVKEVSHSLGDGGFTTRVELEEV